MRRRKFKIKAHQQQYNALLEKTYPLSFEKDKIGGSFADAYNAGYEGRKGGIYRFKRRTAGYIFYVAGIDRKRIDTMSKEKPLSPEEKIKAGIIGTIERRMIAQAFARFMNLQVKELKLSDTNPHALAYRMAYETGELLPSTFAYATPLAAEKAYYNETKYHIDYNLLMEVYGLLTTKRVWLGTKYGYGAVSGYDQVMLAVKTQLCRAKVKEFYIALYDAITFYDEVTAQEPLKSPFIEETDEQQ